MGESPFGHYLFRTHDFRTVLADGRTVDADIFRHQLAVVLVGRHQVGSDLTCVGLAGQGADDIVGLKARYLQHRDVIGRQNLLDMGHGKADALGCGLALGLVFGIGFVAEGAACGVKGHTDVGGLLLGKHLFKGVHKTQYGRCVLALGVDARILDKGIIGPEDKGVCIEKKEFVHVFLIILW